jgi:hypothetical protein
MEEEVFQVINSVELAVFMFSKQQSPAHANIIEYLLDAWTYE